MRIGFIRPSMMGEIAKDAMTPLIFSIIKPLTPEDVEIVFYDERVEELPKELNVDIVAMTVETFSAKRAYKLSERYKKENKKVIMGGFHPTMMPDECEEYADAIIIGEAEDTWGEIIKDLKEDNLKSRYISSNGVDISNTKFDYSVFQGKKYNPIGMVQFSRGCKFSCDFCSIHAFYKDTIRCKSTETIIEELKNMKERYIFFIDDNLFSDERAAKELFKAMIPLNKKWLCQISIDVAKDVELLKLMRESGCILVLIGFESLNIENLKLMGKGANIKYSNYEKVIDNIYSTGLMIYGTFVLGYDYDTPETARKLVDFAIRNKFAIANFNPLMPMPGTRLYERLEEEGRLTYKKWWLHPEYKYGDGMLNPKNMTADELMESCKYARYTFNSYRNIFGRLLNKANGRNIENIGVYLLANFISRFEIKSKQGRKLGGE